MTKALRRARPRMGLESTYLGSIQTRPLTPAFLFLHFVFAVPGYVCAAQCTSTRRWHAHAAHLHTRRCGRRTGAFARNSALSVSVHPPRPPTAPAPVCVCAFVCVRECWQHIVLGLSPCVRRRRQLHQHLWPAYWCACAVRGCVGVWVWRGGGGGVGCVYHHLCHGAAINTSMMAANLP